MARWLVPLAGEHFDLEEFARWFPSGGIHVIEEDGRYYLVGQDLEALPNAEAIYLEAHRALGQFAPIVLLLAPDMKCPAIDGVIRETDEGKRNHFVFLSATLSIRAKVGAIVVSGGTEQQQPQNTQAQDILQRVKADPHLDAAIALWGKPERSWPHLYRILEEIEQHLGEPVSSAGLCSRNKRERFTRTANAAEVSGLDARHALKRSDPPSNPMTIGEANEFIRGLLTSVLR